MSILHRRAAVRARLVEKVGQHDVDLIVKPHAVPFERRGAKGERAHAAIAAASAEASSSDAASRCTCTSGL